jgi:hypothetical protein
VERFLIDIMFGLGWVRCGRGIRFILMVDVVDRRKNEAGEDLKKVPMVENSPPLAQAHSLSRILIIRLSTMF